MSQISSCRGFMEPNTYHWPRQQPFFITNVSLPRLRPLIMISAAVSVYQFTISHWWNYHGYFLNVSKWSLYTTWHAWKMNGITDCVTQDLWAHNWNLAKNFVIIILIIMLQSSHNFAHAMTAQLSWHVQNCDMIGSLFFCIRATNIFVRFG